MAGGTLACGNFPLPRVWRDAFSCFGMMPCAAIKRSDIGAVWVYVGAGWWFRWGSWRWYTGAFLLMRKVLIAGQEIRDAQSCMYVGNGDANGDGNGCWVGSLGGADSKRAMNGGYRLRNK